MTHALDSHEIALEVLNAYDTENQMQPFTARGTLDMAQAYNVT